MSHVYKILEVVGSSTLSSDDAIRNAIATASVTVKNLNWYEVVEHRGHINDGEIGHFQVTVRIGFRLNDKE
ncbi:dodecin [Endozoicomonas lisbonensis]|uniref:Flavin-binding protein dodecin n=1 Tax=Endozoicomonas lisbonensis TaxID=3120522 RepID=A0ABV2SJX8_9GAMM